MSIWLAVSISILLLAANAFFVGAEFALISARRSVIEPKAEEGGRIAGITLKAMENVSLMMAAAQLGITLCTLGLGALAKPAVANAVEGPLDAIGAPQALVYPLAFALALFVVASLHVVLAEMVPKNIALARPDRSAMALAPDPRPGRHRALPGDRLAQLDRQRDPADARGRAPQRGGERLHPGRGRGAGRGVTARGFPRFPREPAARGCSGLRRKHGKVRAVARSTRSRRSR